MAIVYAYYYTWLHCVFVCLFFCEEQLYLSSRVKMKTWERLTGELSVLTGATVCACAYITICKGWADLHVKKSRACPRKLVHEGACILSM